jgi:hypothetical protein
MQQSIADKADLPEESLYEIIKLLYMTWPSGDRPFNLYRETEACRDERNDS